MKRDADGSPGDYFGDYFVDHFDFFRHGPRAKRKSERAKMSNGLRYKVMRRDGFACVLCGATAENDQLVIDHKHPIARGGKTEAGNLRTLCQRCNSGKGTKLDSEA